jgi:hypothetical protein
VAAGFGEGVKIMRVLVACETSGKIRRAFQKRGHDSYSCDLLPADDGDTEFHIIGDALSLLQQSWDLLIAHPPCTRLAVSGARWFETKQVEQRKAIYFFMELANADILKKVIENPIGIMSRLFRKPDQIIQPWQFGHPEAKATCLWLSGLPLLVPTNVLPARGGNPRRGWDNQTPSGQNKLGPSADRWKKRSETYQGIASAMAEQWG